MASVSVGVRLSTERRVLAAAGGLSTASLALVFGVALGALPAAALPRGPDWLLSAIPHVNAALSCVAVPTIALGWRWIRGGEVRRHRASMIAGLLLFVAFLALYLYKVALEGPTAFPGPRVVERFVYLPLLAVHVSLAVICVPLLYAAALLAASRPPEALSETPHPRIGRIAAPLWIASFVLGLVVYLVLYWIY